MTQKDARRADAPPLSDGPLLGCSKSTPVACTDPLQTEANMQIPHIKIGCKLSVVVHHIIYCTTTIQITNTIISHIPLSRRPVHLQYDNACSQGQGKAPMSRTFTLVAGGRGRQGGGTSSGGVVHPKGRGYCRNVVEGEGRWRGF